MQEACLVLCSDTITFSGPGRSRWRFRRGCWQCPRGASNSRINTVQFGDLYFYSLFWLYTSFGRMPRPMSLLSVSSSGG